MYVINYRANKGIVVVGGLLRDLCCLEDPKVKKFEQSRDLLLQHSKPKRLEVPALYCFHRCFQGDTESVF